MTKTLWVLFAAFFGIGVGMAPAQKFDNIVTFDVSGGFVGYADVWGPAGLCSAVAPIVWTGLSGF